MSDTFKLIKINRVKNKPFGDVPDESIEETMIHSEIFTDAISYETVSKTTIPISSYTIKGKPYSSPVDTIEEETIRLNDYSYAVVYLISKQYVNNEKMVAWIDNIEDISVYIKDINDKKAMEKAKKTIHLNEIKANRVSFESTSQKLLSHDSNEELTYQTDNRIQKLVRSK